MLRIVGEFQISEQSATGESRPETRGPYTPWQIKNAEFWKNFQGRKFLKMSGF
jgi:hypothetical protein